MMKINNFLGDLSSIPAKTATLIVGAIQQLDDAIVQLAIRAVLDEGDEMSVGHHYTIWPGEGCREQAFTDSKFFEPIVIASAATETEPEKIAQAPTID